MAKKRGAGEKMPECRRVQIPFTIEQRYIAHLKKTEIQKMAELYFINEYEANRENKV